MPRLDIDTTTMEVAARALAKFKLDYPDRITMWVEAEEGQLDIKISSIAIHKSGESSSMRNHIYFHKTSGLMEI